MEQSPNPVANTRAQPTAKSNAESRWVTTAHDCDERAQNSNNNCESVSPFGHSNTVQRFYLRKCLFAN